MTKDQAIKCLMMHFSGIGPRPSPVILKGEPGTGLLHLIDEMCHMSGNVAQMVIPMPTLTHVGKAGQDLIFPRMDLILAKEADKVLVLVYDQFNCASLQTQAQTWQDIQQNQLLGQPIPNKIVCHILVSTGEPRMAEFISARSMIIKVDLPQICPACGQEIPQEQGATK